jgi:hypothetical protein
MVLSPDTDSEHDYLPDPASLRGDVFLADRGYLDLAYLREMDRQGGFFLVRGKAGLNPRVLNAFREDGQRIKSCQDRDLQAILAKFPKRQRAELEVEWLIKHAPFRLRLIVSWNPETKSFVYLLTNLPPTKYPINTICLGYKLRWQVELLFKEWKSYANLHAFDTEKEALAEALIWASLSAAAIKRFFICRYLSGDCFPAVVYKHFLIRECKDGFESQLSASRSSITLGVSPFGIAPKVADHGFEGTTIPRPIARTQRSKQLGQDVGWTHRGLAG